MMDDIVKRIRQQSYFGLEPYEAADEIEQLRQRVAELEQHLEARHYYNGNRGFKDLQTIEALTAERGELLAALQDMVQLMDSGDEHGAGSQWHTKARAAIASVKDKQNAY